ncbi:serine-threonine protein kinase, putative [Entamoeba invadens IP1]|uniref:serine-threonine protein kinase, putative n=1 Tax=Entamoeba invadens IP1 TaxID=370355 RepID=UPI0002C3EC83|nr:serine-threonine protein kinase, putative [Entamoeba invadens IP1]ELP93299.1 serine-threonine protein kinase, putative [Entamoeba invadens IP1]|eukprot:XP_004260070.1 serine-threonine protein kinase, putative [Entamoeba invadens IP1]
MILLLLACLTQTYGNKTFFFKTHHNEITSMRYVLYLSDLNETAFRLSTTLGDKLNRTTDIIKSETDTLRAETYCIREVVMVLSQRNLSLVEAQMGIIYKTINNFADENSPLAFQKKDYAEVKDTEYILVCKNGLLTIYSGSSFGKKTQVNDTACGEYIAAGDLTVAIKTMTLLNIINIDKDGQAKITKSISLKKYSNTSLTLEYDPLCGNIHNTFYVAVSDRDQIIVFDYADDYTQENYLIVPFYYSNSQPNPQYSNNMATYGSLFVVGAYRYDNNRGRILIYFDHKLTDLTPRFELLEVKEGRESGMEMGYSVSVNERRVYVGGYGTTWEDMIFDSQAIVNNCNERECNCGIGYNYDEEQLVCKKDLKKMNLGIGLGVVVGVLLLILVISIIVAIIVWKYKMRKTEDKAKTYKLNGTEMEFMYNENFPFKFSVEELKFGSEKGPVPVGKKLCDKIVISNRSKKKLKYRVEPPETYRFRCVVKHGVGVLDRGYGVSIEVEIVMNCTCHTEEYLTVVSCGQGNTEDEEIYARIPIKLESVVSPYIDYVEVKSETLVGEGGFGGVFKGNYRGQVVAIKESRNVLTPDERIQYEQEVSTYSSIRNEYIVQFIGSSDVPGHTLMVMEFAPFGSVKSAYLKPEFTELLGMKCLSDCAKGMRFLHANGILHRDLKPDNLLLFSFSPKVQFAAKISDFGTSQSVVSIKENSKQNTQSSQGSQAVGTPMYMAPEMISNLDYGTPIDVFSFAITALEILSKKVPYSDSSLFQHNWDIADFVTTGKRLLLPDTFNSTIKQLITKCWDMNPMKRPQFKEIDEVIEIIFQDFLRKE